MSRSNPPPRPRKKSTYHRVSSTAMYELCTGKLNSPRLGWRVLSYPPRCPHSPCFRSLSLVLCFAFGKKLGAKIQSNTPTLVSDALTKAQAPKDRTNKRNPRARAKNNPLKTNRNQKTRPSHTSVARKPAPALVLERNRKVKPRMHVCPAWSYYHHRRRRARAVDAKMGLLNHSSRLPPVLPSHISFFSSTK